MSVGDALTWKDEAIIEHRYKISVEIAKKLTLIEWNALWAAKEGRPWSSEDAPYSVWRDLLVRELVFPSHFQTRELTELGEAVWRARDERTETFSDATEEDTVVFVVKNGAYRQMAIRTLPRDDTDA